MIRQALAKGLKVNVMVNDVSDLTRLPNSIEVVVGDYTNADKIKTAISGSDAVLSTIGPPMNVELSNRESFNFQIGLTTLLTQMEIQNIKRFINLSGAGIKLPNEKLPLVRKIVRLLTSLMAQSVVKEKDAELELLSKSNCDWTSVRPPFIRVKNGVFRADKNSLSGMTVDPEQVANFMLNSIDSSRWSRMAPVVATL